MFETISSVICFGANSGSVVIDSITGGNEPYDIQWGSVDNTNLFAGTYDVRYCRFNRLRSFGTICC